MIEPVVLAVDIGGTKTALGFVTESGEVLKKDTIDTGNSPDPNELIGRIRESCNNLFSSFKSIYEISGIGIGAPNANYFKGTVDHPANLKWKGVTQLTQIFTEHFQLPSTVTNDANAAALG